ncbi:helix-turn-helix transcriptional regulator [Roseospira goensis]|uniref:DNA-binding XRE family transcriptional regulator n=1 Tax=Roseospira goensis TaxID=391922 RepID=A0A7W6WMU0_9PROT|nr:helix-turn-helix transcriptional regulator [Roseospira goensis]MBB4287837.1 DNA-binding XRE family transcriptional regulator [Roseospira goensis]
MTAPDTITMSRAEYTALLERLEDAEDRARIAERRDDPTIGHDNLKRILAGEHPVKVWREEKGLKQNELAATAGISAPMLNDIEKGRRTPSLDVARRLASALGLTLDDLFD